MRSLVEFMSHMSFTLCWGFLMNFDGVLRLIWVLNGEFEQLNEQLNALLTLTGYFDKQIAMIIQSFKFSCLKLLMELCINNGTYFTGIWGPLRCLFCKQLWCPWSKLYLSWISLIWEHDVICIQGSPWKTQNLNFSRIEISKLFLRHLINW